MATDRNGAEMSNYTILQRNTLDGFEHDDTKALYLRGCHINEIKALYMADQWEKYLRGFKCIVEFAASQHEDNPHSIYTKKEDLTEDVMNYLKERHYRSYFPQN